MMLGILTIAPLTVSAATYGDFEYTLNEGYTCTITGYNGSAANVTIPSTIYGYKVVSIYSGAFSENLSMESVTISNSVEYIGLNAFSGCTNLKNIDIRTSGNNIIRICDSAFPIAQVLKVLLFQVMLNFYGLQEDVLLENVRVLKM